MQSCTKTTSEWVVDNFNEILALVKDDLTKQNTHLRESIPAEIKLGITLRYLATENA